MILMLDDNRGGLFHWRKCYYGLWTQKNILMMDLFITNMQLFTSQDINWCSRVLWGTCGLLWCFYQLFGLSFWRHPFTAEDPLVSKGHDANFFKSVQVKTAWRWRIFFFLVNYFFNGIWIKCRYIYNLILENCKMNLKMNSGWLGSVNCCSA